ncbi:3-oxoadipate enol-lactonase [Acuticoccus sp. M5D2P5]|uniref:3-oxoadipate enol-lactonase n=1 Tax=Acuticoccus kalidii TaxID=2910977 RepID=UPI001F3A4A37|nr:3-oxoadipate enol-lactonase [Acuticoccus kalidii]MCF3935803.1 3-oxoadipate enol-lactonase [Acuticoccus kalidii]
MPFVELSGVVFHCEARLAAPGAPTILFSNSLGTDFRTWDAVVAALPERYGIIRYDNRGHGLTDIAPASTLDIHVGDVIALLDHFGVEKAVVCGLSVGGTIAIGTGVAHPDRVAALILCCTGAKISTADDWDRRIAAVREGGIEALREATLGRWFPPSFHAGEATTLAGIRNMLVRQTAPGYIEICTMLRDADLREPSRAITAPTLAIAGSEDKSCPPALLKETAERIPGARYVEMAGSGHIPCIDAPDALAGHIVDFLDASGL